MKTCGCCKTELTKHNSSMQIFNLLTFMYECDACGMRKLNFTIIEPIYFESVMFG